MHKTCRNNCEVIWIIFTGETDLKFLQFLKKGFRHCFVVMQTENGWITIDPLYLNIDINHYRDKQKNIFLPQWFEQQGYKVVQAIINKPTKRKIYFSPYSCVEVIKKIIGLNNFFIMTPWQLYKYLKKKGNYNG